MSDKPNKSKKKTAADSANDPWAATKKTLQFFNTDKEIDRNVVNDVFNLANDHESNVNAEQYKANAMKCMDTGYPWLAAYWCDRYLQSVLDKMWTKTFDWLISVQGERKAGTAANVAMESLGAEFKERWG